MFGGIDLDSVNASPRGISRFSSLDHFTPSLLLTGRTFGKDRQKENRYVAKRKENSKCYQHFTLGVVLDEEPKCGEKSLLHVISL